VRVYVGRLPAQQRTLSRSATAAWRREVVMPAAPLCIGGMRAAAFQFFGNFSELGREFQQRLPRVDLWRLFREPQAFFGMLAAFFWHRHGGDPVCATSTQRYRSAPTAVDEQVVASSILDNLEHCQERAGEAAASRNKCQILTQHG
jgi:hypothetical protein